MVALIPNALSKNVIVAIADKESHSSKSYNLVSNVISSSVCSTSIIDSKKVSLFITILLFLYMYLTLNNIFYLFL